MSTHRTIIITTMSAKGYEQYGHRFWDSYIKTVPPLELAVYSEDALPIPHQRLTLQEGFVNRNKHRPTRNWKYDAVRFCYKPYAIRQAMNLYGDSTTTMGSEHTRLLWIDADTVFKQQITEQWITKNLYRETAYLSYFGRPNYHSETGVMLFNLEHPQTELYVNSVIDLYNTDNIYTLAEWHDSYVWDTCRTPGAHNISEHVPKVPAGHIINYMIGNTLDHTKGKRKQQGYSKEQQHDT